MQQQAEAEAILTVHFKALAAPITQPTCSLLRPILDLALTRNEVVSLFNAFGKISTSIVQLERFREMLRKKT